MDKKDCMVGQDIAYFPKGLSGAVEFGIVTELRESWAMVRFEEQNISKATRYLDIEPVTEKLISKN